MKLTRIKITIFAFSQISKRQYTKQKERYYSLRSASPSAASYSILLNEHKL